jgi:hypothetical protein
MAREASMEIADRSYFFWRGGLSILMGILVLAWPSLTVLVFVTFISIWLFLLGVVNIVEGVRKVGKGGWGWLGSLAVGFVELGVGAYLIQRPGVTTLTIISLIGLVFVVQGLAFIAKTFLDPVASGGHRVLSLRFIFGCRYLGLALSVPRHTSICMASRAIRFGIWSFDARHGLVRQRINILKKNKKEVFYGPLFY